MKQSHIVSEAKEWMVSFYIENHEEILCTLKMTSIPSEGPTFFHEGIPYQIIKVEGDRAKKDF